MNKENLAQRISNQVKKTVSRLLPRPGIRQGVPEQDQSSETTEVVFPKDGIVQTYDKEGNPIDSRSIYNSDEDHMMGL